MAQGKSDLILQANVADLVSWHTQFNKFGFIFYFFGSLSEILMMLWVFFFHIDKFLYRGTSYVTFHFAEFILSKI